MAHSTKRPFRPLSPFLAWPSFFATPPLVLSSVVHGLELSQTEQPEALELGRQTQLRLLLEWAVNNVPYYRKATGYADMLASIRRRPDELDAVWARLPILTKAQLRSHGPRLHAPSLPAGHGKVLPVRTSGSTGILVEVATTSLTRTIWDALTIREHLWQRRNFSGRLGVTRFRSPNERSLGGYDAPTWGSPVTAMFTTGPGSVIHVGHSVADLAAWLARFNPHYLLTYPSVAAALLAEIGSNRPEALEEIRLISEPLDPELEQRLAAQWNVRCANIYSANEVGYIAFQCAERDGLHVQSESVFVEILDAKGQPCANGETGRVVVTPLHNLAMPLIRYEIGDFATVGASCACGRALPIIQDVRGRVRNMVRTPDGRRFWPTSMNGIRKIPPVRQAQFVQPTVDRIEVRVVLDRPLTAAEAEQAIAFVRTTFGYPFDVSLAVVEAIERGPTGKFEEFLSLLPDERT